MTVLRVLVTNDDGVGSRGLGILASRLAADGHDVLVAAPAAEASGSAAAIGGILEGEEIVTSEVALPDAPHVRSYAVEGPPGRCVLAACLGGFGPAPDLVVSGINPGANVGRFLQLHSGTLGAVLTAAGLGLSGMAVSIRPQMPEHWETAAEVASRLVDYVGGCERRTTLNVNVPDLPFDELQGLRSAQLGAGGPKRLALVGSAPGRLRMTWVDRTPGASHPDHDSALLDGGFVAVTRVLPPATTDLESLPDGLFGVVA